MEMVYIKVDVAGFTFISWTNEAGIYVTTRRGRK